MAVVIWIYVLLLVAIDVTWVWSAVFKRAPQTRSGIMLLAAQNCLCVAVSLGLTGTFQPPARLVFLLLTIALLVAYFIELNRAKKNKKT
jgi:hypothetical protein